MSGKAPKVKTSKSAAPGADDISISQLRVLAAICDNDCNVTAAAAALGIAQPSVSKKLSLLEKAIGKPLFYRNGRRLQYETDVCRRVVAAAREVLLKCDNMLAMGEDGGAAARGELHIGTTHMQARYVLPKALAEFRRIFPGIGVNMTQASPPELVDMLAANRVDLVICTEALENNINFRTMISYSWNRMLIVRSDHPLAGAKEIGFAELAAYPMITYNNIFTGRTVFDEAFAHSGCQMKIVLAAADADVIKTYVRHGMGIGVISDIAFEPARDGDLVCHSLAHLFPQMHVRLAYLQDKFVTAAMQCFIDLFRKSVRKRGGRRGG